jgi:hypothetical protein
MGKGRPPLKVAAPEQNLAWARELQFFINIHTADESQLVQMYHDAEGVGGVPHMLELVFGDGARLQLYCMKSGRDDYCKCGLGWQMFDSTHSQGERSLYDDNG